MSGKSTGSTSMARSRRTLRSPSMYPLCIHNQRPWRNGWQLVCWTGDPVDARMCASTRGDTICPASSRRLRSFQAGSVLRNTPGVSPVPYQPTPKPSPFVVSAPSCECRLWTTSEFLGLYRSSSIRIGAPEYASQRHIPTSLGKTDRTPATGGRGSSARGESNGGTPVSSVLPISLRHGAAVGGAGCGRHLVGQVTVTCCPQPSGSLVHPSITSPTPGDDASRHGTESGRRRAGGGRTHPCAGPAGGRRQQDPPARGEERTWQEKTCTAPSTSCS